MRKLKIFICAIVGAFCGALLMYLLLPAICDYFVGPIYGEDQTSVNASIFFIGTPVMFIIGAIVGWFLGWKYIKHPRRDRVKQG